MLGWFRDVVNAARQIPPPDLRYAENGTLESFLHFICDAQSPMLRRPACSSNRARSYARPGSGHPKGCYALTFHLRTPTPRGSGQSRSWNPHGSPAENLTLLQIPGTHDFVFRRLESGPRKGISR
jgi:hypothetical protein